MDKINVARGFLVDQMKGKEGADKAFQSFNRRMKAWPDANAMAWARFYCGEEVSMTDRSYDANGKMVAP